MFQAHRFSAYSRSRKSSSNKSSYGKSRGGYIQGSAAVGDHHETSQLTHSNAYTAHGPHAARHGAPAQEPHFLDRFPGSGCGYRNEALLEVNRRWQEENGLCFTKRAPSVDTASTTGTYNGAPSSVSSVDHAEFHQPTAFTRQRKDGKVVLCCVTFAPDEVREYVPETPYSTPSAPEHDDLCFNDDLESEDSSEDVVLCEAPREAVEEPLWMPQPPALHHIAQPNDIHAAVKRGEALDVAIGGTGISKAVAEACGTLFLPSPSHTTPTTEKETYKTEPPRQQPGGSRAPRAEATDASGKPLKHGPEVAKFVAVHRDLYVDAHRQAGQKESGFGGFLEGFFEFFRHKQSTKVTLNPRYNVHGSRMQAHVPVKSKA